MFLLIVALTVFTILTSGGYPLLKDYFFPEQVIVKNQDCLKSMQFNSKTFAIDNNYLASLDYKQGKIFTIKNTQINKNRHDKNTEITINCQDDKLTNVETSGNFLVTAPNYIKTSQDYEYIIGFKALGQGNCPQETHFYQFKNKVKNSYISIIEEQTRCKYDFLLPKVEQFFNLKVELQ